VVACPAHARVRLVIDLEREVEVLPEPEGNALVELRREGERRRGE
jgi:hypothetical protein